MATSLKAQILKRIIKDTLTIEENVLLSKDIFVAKAIVEWVLSTTKDPKVINSFVVDLIKHLNGTTRLAWIEELFSNIESEKNDYLEKQRKEKGFRAESK